MAKQLSITGVVTDITNGITLTRNRTRTTTTDQEDGNVVIVGTTETTYTIPLVTLGLLIFINETNPTTDQNRWIDIGWATGSYLIGRPYTGEMIIMPINRTGGPYTIYMIASAANSPLRIQAYDPRAAV